MCKCVPPRYRIPGRHNWSVVWRLESIRWQFGLRIQVEKEDGPREPWKVFASERGGMIVRAQNTTNIIRCTCCQEVSFQKFNKDRGASFNYWRSSDILFAVVCVGDGCNLIHSIVFKSSTVKFFYPKWIFCSDPELIGSRIHGTHPSQGSMWTYNTVRKRVCLSPLFFYNIET